MSPAKTWEEALFEMRLTEAVGSARVSDAEIVSRAFSRRAGIRRRLGWSAAVATAAATLTLLAVFGRTSTGPGHAAGESLRLVAVRTAENADGTAESLRWRGAPAVHYHHALRRSRAVVLAEVAGPADTRADEPVAATMTVKRILKGTKRDLPAEVELCAYRLDRPEDPDHPKPVATRPPTTRGELYLLLLEPVPSRANRTDRTIRPAWRTVPYAEAEGLQARTAVIRLATRDDPIVEETRLVLALHATPTPTHEAVLAALASRHFHARYAGFLSVPVNDDTFLERHATDAIRAGLSLLDWPRWYDQRARGPYGVGKKLCEVTGHYFVAENNRALGERWHRWWQTNRGRTRRQWMGASLAAAIEERERHPESLAYALKAIRAARPIPDPDPVPALIAAVRHDIGTASDRFRRSGRLPYPVYAYVPAAIRYLDARAAPEAAQRLRRQVLDTLRTLEALAPAQSGGALVRRLRAKIEADD